MYEFVKLTLEDLLNTILFSQFDQAVMKINFGNIFENYMKIPSNKGAIVENIHKKWSSPLKISSANVTKSTVSYGFGHTYWRNP